MYFPRRSFLWFALSFLALVGSVSGPPRAAEGKGGPIKGGPAKADAGEAAADEVEGYEETEHRLKSAGIDAPMREEIHDAIRRAVARLRSQQFKGGGLPGPAGQTALGALALRHAAIPDAVRGADAALRWILRYAAKEVAKKTYEGGIVSMLLDATDSHPKFQRRIHTNLSKGPRSNYGYWGYETGGAQPPANLSTAQFACLGLWAAERRGAPVAEKAWRLHLEALQASQGTDGSWAYRPAHAPENGAKNQLGPTYPTGTFMGLADLLLARQALLEELNAEPEDLAAVDVAAARGRAALRRHVQWVLGGPHMPGALGTFSFYRLYALEKVCIFANREDVGGIPWYRDGARWLLDTQLADGGWATLAVPPPGRRRAGKTQSQVQATSFALLFLLRASAAYHPVTPRPIDTRSTPITPSPAAPGSAPAPAAETAPPLEAAARAVSVIESALTRGRLTQLTRCRDAMRLITRTYAASLQEGAFATSGHDIWARRAEAVLLRVAVRFMKAKPNDRLLWKALAFDAFEALAGTHPRVARPLMKQILSREGSAAFRAEDQYAWYSAALDTLRRVKAPALAPWLGARVLSPEPEHYARCAAALTTIGGMSGLLKGSARHQAARAIYTRLPELFRRSLGNREVAHLIRDVQITTWRLARGSERAPVPGLAGAISPATGEALMGWWRRHKERDDPLWSD